METEFSKNSLSRRQFLKLSGLGLAGFIMPPYLNKPEGVKVPSKEKIAEISAGTIVAKKAALYAQSIFGKQKYSFGKADCAMFAGEFARYLGIPVGKDNTSPSSYSPEVVSYLPDATTVKQALWFEMINKHLGKDYIKEFETKQLADEDFWVQINPGSLIYLRTKGESQHGYDQFSHVAAYLGLNEDNKPIFGEYARGMNSGPQVSRSLYQLMRMYYGNIPDDLKATVVDTSKIAIEICRFGTEVVTPNSEQLIKNGYEKVLTVNLNNGLVSYWSVDNDEYQRDSFANGGKELYSVVGRKLLSRLNLTVKYDQFINQYSNLNSQYEQLKYSSYDGRGGIFRGTPLCIPRLSLTPPLIFELESFAIIGNFGNLGGYTDIAIMRVLSETKGKLIKVDENSNYTIHATPQNTRSEQDLLLRDNLLNKANISKKPLSPEDVHLTSGCVNFTPEIFEVVKKSIDKNKKTAVVFSYPGLSQDTQLKSNQFIYKYDPLGGPMVNLWGYSEL